MAKRPKIKQDIKDATEAFKIIMQENLSEIASAMIEQVMSGYRNLPESQRFNAIKDVSAKGVNAYKEKMLEAMSVVAYDSIQKARKEVPKKKDVRLTEIDEDAIQLGEFDKLPADMQKRIKSMLNLLVGTQIGDLEKSVFFQYQSSVDSTDSEAQVKKDLEDSAAEFIGGNSINGGASAYASQVVNEARLAFFIDDEVSKEVEAFEFVNEDPVSPICNDLAGTVFSKDDPNLNRYWPPLHFNCNSWIRPILVGNLKGREVDELKPSNKKLEDYIQFSEQQINTILNEIKNPIMGELKE